MTSLKFLATAALLATVATAPTLSHAAGGVCGLPSDGSWQMVDGDEQIGQVRLGETPSGLVMDGEVDGSKISYRMQACKGEGTGMMVPNHGSDGPPQVFLSKLSDGEIELSFKEEDGSEVFLSLVKQ